MLDLSLSFSFMIFEYTQYIYIYMYIYIHIIFIFSYIFDFFLGCWPFFVQRSLPAVNSYDLSFRPPHPFVSAAAAKASMRAAPRRLSSCEMVTLHSNRFPPKRWLKERVEKFLFQSFQLKRFTDRKFNMG